MKLKEQKRILIFLEILAERLQIEKDKGVHPNLIKHFSREELIDVVLWLFNDTWKPSTLSNKTDTELVDLIGNNVGILLYVINKLEERFNTFPKYDQSEADEFFARTDNQIHYLASKPVEEWDKYDKSNYRSLLLKTGTTKKVFAIFTADVLAEDVYTVTTKPSSFFDTEEEAELEILNIIAEGKFTRDELTIHSLWLLQ